MNILILGSLPKDEARTKLYEDIISVCSRHADSVSSPIDTAKFEGSDEERYARAVRKVKEADLIIGEQSSPSTGQGIEIGIAYTLDKPFVAIAKEGSKVSGLVRGNPITKRIIYYRDNDDLMQKIDDFLEDESN